MAYVIKKIRNMASNFQAPTYIKKGNKRQKKIWDGKKRARKSRTVLRLAFVMPFAFLAL